MTLSCIACRAELQENYRSCPACGDQISEFLRTYRNTLIDGKYEIVDRLGKGGMGEVYQVRHVLFNTDRVLKVMRSELLDRPEARERFVREARVAEMVLNPHVARVIDVAPLPDGTLYMTTELIVGTSLKKVITESGRLSVARCMRLSVQVLNGLESIHKAGLVHRDIAPDNVMLAGTGESEKAVIIDFGVAKQLDAESTMSERGGFVGKLRYASPEQLGFSTEGKIDARSDLYSFGVMLYEMLSGRVPFDASSTTELIRLQLVEPPPPLDLSDAPPNDELKKILFQALAKDRSERPRDAATLAANLSRVAEAITPADTEMVDSSSAEAPSAETVPILRSSEKPEPDHDPNAAVPADRRTPFYRLRGLLPRSLVNRLILAVGVAALVLPVTAEFMIFRGLDLWVWNDIPWEHQVSYPFKTYLASGLFSFIYETVCQDVLKMYLPKVLVYGLWWLASVAAFAVPARGIELLSRRYAPERITRLILSWFAVFLTLLLLFPRAEYFSLFYWLETGGLM